MLAVRYFKKPSPATIVEIRSEVKIECVMTLDALIRNGLKWLQTSRVSGCLVNKVVFLSQHFILIVL